MTRLRQQLAIFACHQGGDRVGAAFQNIGKFQQRRGTLARVAGPVGCRECGTGGHHRFTGQFR